MNIVIVAAHTDDDWYGCGGTIHKLLREKATVTILVAVGLPHELLTVVHGQQLINERSRTEQRICQELSIETRNLGLYDQNIDINECTYEIGLTGQKFGIIDLAFIPSPYDVNKDHQDVHQACRVAFRSLTGQVKKVLCYEVPSSTDQAGIQHFHPNVFIPLQEADIEEKISALAELDSGVMKPPPHPRSATNIRALATLRGSAINVGYAEAFMLYREVL